jgi:hypothetical protein
VLPLARVPLTHLIQLPASTSATLAAIPISGYTVCRPGAGQAVQLVGKREAARLESRGSLKEQSRGGKPAEDACRQPPLQRMPAGMEWHARLKEINTQVQYAARLAALCGQHPPLPR